MAKGMLFHDDAVADFGGNDGTASNQFYLATGVKPTVIDCEPGRLSFARDAYGLKTIRAFLEDLSAVPDRAFRYGFCSHTIEHTRDPEKALREIARVIAEEATFVLPLESHKHGEDNHAHSVVCTKPSQWKALLEANGWRVKHEGTMKSRGAIGINVHPVEYSCIAEPS